MARSTSTATSSSPRRPSHSRWRTGGLAVLDALVLDASLRQSLVAVRSLGREGLMAGAADSDSGAAAFRSRWCRADGIVPDVALGAGAYVDAVLALLRARPARVLLTSHDGSIAALRARRDDLDRVTSLALAPEPALDLAMDKGRTLALAETLGVAVPRGAPADALADVAPALAETGLPAVVKPRCSWIDGEVGARVVPEVITTPDEARRAVERMLVAGGSTILQQWIPGRREAVSLLVAQSRVRASFAQVAHRMNPPLGGESVVRESIPVPRDSGAAAERLALGAGLEGYSEIEFRRDTSGRPVLMEINPRLSASVEIAVRAGVDFPLLVYRWAAGERLPSPARYRAGVRVRWLGGDIYWLRRTLRSQGRPDVLPAGRAIGAFLGAFLVPSAYDYVDRADMRPALAAGAGFLRRLAGAQTHDKQGGGLRG